MEDVRNVLLKSLVPALETATGKSVFTRIPKDAATYPYIYISDIYQEEDGTKTEFHYRLDVLVQVLYKDATSLSGLFSDMTNVLSIINNGVPFELDDPHSIMDCTLNSSNTTEFQTETGTVNAGLIRIYFRIK